MSQHSVRHQPPAIVFRPHIPTTVIWKMISYIWIIMHMVSAFLCFVVIRVWLILPLFVRITSQALKKMSGFLSLLFHVFHVCDFPYPIYIIILYIYSNIHLEAPKYRNTYDRKHTFNFMFPKNSSAHIGLTRKASCLLSPCCGTQWPLLWTSRAMSRLASAPV